MKKLKENNSFESLQKFIVVFDHIFLFNFDDKLKVK